MTPTDRMGLVIFNESFHAVMPMTFKA